MVGSSDDDIRRMLTAEEARDMAARSHAHNTPHGLRVSYDDGQTVWVEGIEPCPWCGPRDRFKQRPFIQTHRLGDWFVDARVVCPMCHVATSDESEVKAYRKDGGEDVTRDLAIEKAYWKWNRRGEDL